MEGPLKGYLWTTASSYEYILGNYEDPLTLKTFLSWLKPDTVYYDIGANIGYHALAANLVITKGKIYAFEPMPAVREIFEKHISLNSNLIIKNNIEVLPFAVSDTQRDVEFSNNTVQKDGNTYITESPVFRESENKITIPCYSIDGLLANGYHKPDVIKIDVEGAELDVLHGALFTLQTHRPYILLATHDCHLPGVKDKCISFLQDLGYDLQHTGNHNKHIAGLDDYIAIHKSRL
ncbi:MAG: FkbM family methyltransferase [Ferruginibacter sp.]